MQPKMDKVEELLMMTCAGRWIPACAGMTDQLEILLLELPFLFQSLVLLLLRNALVFVGQVCYLTRDLQICVPFRSRKS